MRAFRDYFRAPVAKGRKLSGLFGIKNLNSADGLTNFAQNCLTRAQSLAHELRSPNVAANAGAAEIRKLDELSDSLCRAVDMAAFLRIAHPSPQMVEAAQQVHELLFGFMNELNTSRELFQLVESALKNDQVQDEERKVGEILRHDFLKSGLQFAADSKRQSRFIELSNQISVRGQYFLMGCGEPQTEDLYLTPGELSGVSPTLLAKLATSSSSSSIFQGQIRIPASQTQLMEHILASTSSSKSRAKIWHYLKRATDQQVGLLDGVLRDRQELAQLAGYDTYANYELSDKMMQNSDNVNKFLTSLASQAKPQALAELEKMGSPKGPWDYYYYFSKYRSQLRRTLSPPTFDLTGVFHAVNELVGTLYGLRFEPGNVDPGEVWAPDVRRLDVYDGDEKIGIIYCDLLTRPGKQPNPAHFTIQCSRKNVETGETQLPIIVLVCDFDTPGKLSDVQLQYHEVETLFHEMGHAIHSMIGRTRLHNVAGTRCATDFVELPSILFEKFAATPSVLELIKPKFDASQFLSKQSKIDAATEHWETWHQLSLSFLDQALHNEQFVHTPSSEQVSNDITDKYTLFSEVPLSQQHVRQFAHFGHLVSYGSTYYSYLFDRCLASMAWDLLFKTPSTWEKGGHQFKDHVLRWGGAKDPRECIQALFGREIEYDKLAASLNPVKK